VDAQRAPIVALPSVARMPQNTKARVCGDDRRQVAAAACEQLIRRLQAALRMRGRLD